MDFWDNFIIVKNSDMVGRFCFWDTKTNEFIPPSLVSGWGGNAIFDIDYVTKFNDTMAINKSIRLIYFYMETLNFLHFTPVQGLYDNKKNFSLYKQENKNIDWVKPYYNKGMFFPVEAYKLINLPFKNSAIILNNFLRMNKQPFFNYLNNNIDYCYLSDFFSLDYQAKILFKIKDIFDFQSSNIIIQTLDDNVFDKKIKQYYYPDEIDFHIPLSCLNYFSHSNLLNNIKNDSMKNNNYTPNKNKDYLLKISNSYDLQKLMISNKTTLSTLIDIQIFTLIDEKIKNENLNINNLDKWINSIVDDKWVTQKLDSNNITKKVDKIKNIYLYWSNKINDFNNNYNKLDIFNDIILNNDNNFNFKKPINKINNKYNNPINTKNKNNERER